MNADYVAMLRRDVSNITEGGNMRMHRAISALDCYCFYSNNSLISALRYLRNTSRKKILLFYPGLPCGKIKGVFFLMLAKLFCYLNKNRLIVDIADIRRKQSQALGYKLSKIHYVGAFIYEWLILSMADEIWFASKRMACYERKIFKFKKEKVKIVINTGVLAEDYPIKTLEQGKFRFVCAGGLSKNRGAEFLIKAYLLNPPPNSELHLCGEGGEWIQERFDSDKITFWGSLSESEAISLLRACDCGVIPYPNQFYYNMIFPSKLSLYITCGLPVTAFRGSESGETIERGQIGLTFDDNLSDLNGALHKISMPDVYSRLKENVIKVKFKYINSYVYKEAIKGMK